MDTAIRLLVKYLKWLKQAHIQRQEKDTGNNFINTPNTRRKTSKKGVGNRIAARLWPSDSPSSQRKKEKQPLIYERMPRKVGGNATNGGDEKEDDHSTLGGSSLVNEKH